MVEKITEWALAVLPGSIVLLLVIFSVLCFVIWRALSKLVSVHESSLRSLDHLASVNERAIKNQSAVLDDHIKLNDKLKAEILSLERKIVSMSEEMTREKVASNELAISEVKALSSAFEQFRIDAHQTKSRLNALSFRLEAVEVSSGRIGVSAADDRDRMASQTRASNEEFKDEKAFAESSIVFRGELSKLERKRRWSNFPVNLSPLEGAAELKAELEANGITCGIYFSSLTRSEEDFNEGMYDSKPNHMGIWLGHRVPLDVIKKSFTIARRHWPFLRFVEVLHQDQNAPDYVHDQIYFGGATSSVKRKKLKEISDQTFGSLLGLESLSQFHDQISAINRPSR